MFVAVLARRTGRLLFTLCFLIVCSDSVTGEHTVDFEADIAPLIVRRCVECHRDSEASGGLNLTTRNGWRDGGDSGSVVDLSDPRDSYLLQRVAAGEMPPEKKGASQRLPVTEIKQLEAWLAGGMPWPKSRKLDWFERSSDLRAGRDWWSLQPIRRPPVPPVTGRLATGNPIDAFVRARLEQNEMHPAPRADRRTLLRRLSFDLLGLPVTKDAVDRFVNDSRPEAWERAVDRLLHRPQFGQRWARYWLDLVRYADTSGYERDQEKPFAWKYRDWVVDALNQDLPYDQFVIAQLAGDEMPARDQSTVIATGFLRLGTWNDEPNDPADYVYDRLEDLVHVTSTAFLAMTVKCARCHAHKFDPITQRDYYRMASVFWPGPIQPRRRELLGGPTSEELGAGDILGWTDITRRPPPIHVLKNGDRHQPMQEVVPASLSMIESLHARFNPPPTDSQTSRRRLQLAHWIVEPRNPLTARVIVNRIWQHHFGEAIVRSPNNFGFLADPPTHPQLLDWLASELIENGWSQKHIHRLILTSETWRQSSRHPRWAEFEMKDSSNRLWWRAERRRLDAEALRDAMLAVSGELDRRLGGPGFRPTTSRKAIEGLSMKSAAWQASPASEQRRRSLYMFAKRGLLSPMMTTFDFCDTTLPCGQRTATTVPTQALALMNNRFIHDRSRQLAATFARRQSAIDSIWQRFYARSPTRAERTAAAEFLAEQTQRFVQAKRADRDTTDGHAIDSVGAHRRALASLAHVLFSSNEFLYID